MDDAQLITFATSIGLLLVKRPLWALVWILSALFFIPADKLGIASFVMFILVTFSQFQKV